MDAVHPMEAKAQAVLPSRIVCPWCDSPTHHESNPLRLDLCDRALRDRQVIGDVGGDLKRLRMPGPTDRFRDPPMRVVGP